MPLGQGTRGLVETRASWIITWYAERARDVTMTQLHGARSAAPPAGQEIALEHIACNLCGADDPQTIYEARYEAASRADLTHVFRASGDELLVDRLVRCRQCGLE